MHRFHPRFADGVTPGQELIHEWIARGNALHRQLSYIGALDLTGHGRPGSAVEDIGDDLAGCKLVSRNLRRHLRPISGDHDAQLGGTFAGCRHEARRVVEPVDRQDMHAVRSTVHAVRTRDAAPVVRAAPPAAGCRRQYMMMMRPGSCKARVGTQIVMLRGVHVSGKAQRMRAAGEQLQQCPPIDGGVGGVRTVVMRCDERYVHGDNDQMVMRYMLQEVAHELQLGVAEFARIAAVAGRVRMAAGIVDIVEHDEGRIAVLEGIVARAKDAFPGLAGMSIVGSVPVEIVIARAVMPADASGAEKLQ